jgi:hypothetical protein
MQSEPEVYRQTPLRFCKCQTAISGTQTIFLIDVIGMSLLVIALIINGMSDADKNDDDGEKDNQKLYAFGIFVGALTFITMFAACIIYVIMRTKNYSERWRKLYFMVRLITITFDTLGFILVILKVMKGKPWLVIGPLVNVLAEIYFVYFLYKFQAIEQENLQKVGGYFPG